MFLLILRNSVTCSFDLMNIASQLISWWIPHSIRLVQMMDLWMCMYMYVCSIVCFLPEIKIKRLLNTKKKEHKAFPVYQYACSPDIWNSKFISCVYLVVVEMDGFYTDSNLVRNICRGISEIRVPVSIADQKMVGWWKSQLTNNGYTVGCRQVLS